jgi:DNA-binding NarL/FixJ family response regulator
LWAKAENTVIDEHYARMVPDASSGRHVMITVSDTGAGIPEHIKTKSLTRSLPPKIRALDGAATIRALQKLDPQVRIIASTGSSHGMRSEDAEKLGVKSILSKPYTAETLLKALAASLDREADGEEAAAAITVDLYGRHDLDSRDPLKLTG